MICFLVIIVLAFLVISNKELFLKLKKSDKIPTLFWYLLFGILFVLFIGIIIVWLLVSLYMN